MQMTVEQQFKMRRLQDLLPDAKKEDIITVFLSLQHQNFCLTNTVSNLVKQWPLAPSITDQVGKSETSSANNN
jgi:hypothetical protein